MSKNVANAIRKEERGQISNLSPQKTSAFRLNFRKDGVAIIEINVPGEKQNTLKAEFAEQFAEVFNELESSKGLKAVVIGSTKPGSFVAGADINLFDTVESADEAAELSRACQFAFARIENFRVPIVAAI